MLVKTSKKQRPKKGSKKWRRQVSNTKRGKYRKAFIRCVKRTGKWRGKAKTLDDAR
jgi:hypothetical protein